MSSSIPSSCTGLSGAMASPSHLTLSLPMAREAATPACHETIAIPKPLHYTSDLTNAFIQRLEPFFNVHNNSPISLEIFSHLTLKEYIDIAYLKLIDILAVTGHSDYISPIMKTLRSLSEEDPSFSEKIEDIKKYTKIYIDFVTDQVKKLNPQSLPPHLQTYRRVVLEDLPKYRGVLEFLLNCKSEYSFQIGKTKHGISPQENRQKIIHYILEIMNSDLTEDLKRITSRTLNFSIKDYSTGNIQQIVKKEFGFYILAWFESVQAKGAVALKGREDSFVEINRLLQTARESKSKFISLTKEISDLEFILSTFAKIGKISMSFCAEDKRKLEKVSHSNHIAIVENISQFFELLSQDIPALILKHNKIEGLTGPYLFNAISQILIKLCNEGVSEKMDQEMSKHSDTLKGPSPRISKLGSPEMMEFEKELSELITRRANKLITQFHSFTKKIEFPESIEFIKKLFSSKGLKIAICRCVYTSFQSVFTSSDLKENKLSFEEVNDFLRKVGKQVVQEAQEDRSPSFWNLEQLIDQALGISQGIEGRTDAYKDILSMLRLTSAKINEILYTRFKLVGLLRRLMDLYFPALEALQNANPPSDELSWIEWIDAEEDLDQNAVIKRAEEKKGEDSSEEEEISSEKPIEYVSRSYIPKVQKAQIHCDTSSLAHVVDSTKKLLSDLYGLQHLVPSQSSSKLSRGEVAQRQQIYAFNQVIAILNALRSSDDQKVQEKLLSQFFHFGHMAIEQGATVHYLQRHPNRLNIPHDINMLLNDFGCRFRNLWTNDCPSASLYLRYPSSCELRAHSPLALRHMALPQPNTLKEAAPHNLRLWVIDLVRSHLEILEKTLPQAKKEELQTFERDFDAFAQPAAAAAACESVHSAHKLSPFEPYDKGLTDAERTMRAAEHHLSQFLRNQRLPKKQRQSLENALHHLRSLSEEPHLLRRLPEQESLSIHGHRYLIAAQYFIENLGKGLIYDKENEDRNQLTHDLNAIFRNLSLDTFTSKEIAYLHSLNVFKGSEYVIKYFARRQKRGPEFSTMDFMDRLYSFAQAGEEFTPAGQAKPKENLHKKLVEDIQTVAQLAEKLVQLLIQQLTHGEPARRSSGSGAAA